MEINENVSLNANTIVRFKMGDDIEGLGVIKGIATNGSPVIGKSYIVEILCSKGIDKKLYPYSSMIVFEKFIEVVQCN